MTRRLRIILTLPVIAAALVGVVTHGNTSARASEGAGATGEGGRFSNYRAPTGPEMTPVAAATIALKAVRFEEKEHGSTAPAEVNLTVGHGTFAEAKAVLEGKSASAAETGLTVGCLDAQGQASRCPTPIETVERRNSGAYLVVVTGRQFSPNVPVPRGRKGPSGSVRAVVLNSITGFLEEEYVGPWIPQATSLKAVTTLSSATVEAAAVNAGAAASGGRPRSVKANRHLGYLEGHVYRRGRSVVGWRVLIGRRRVARGGTFARTFPDGTFLFHVLAGRYVVAAERPDGKLCGEQNKRVVAKRKAHIVIECH